jgi:hypothetical protein
MRPKTLLQVIIGPGQIGDLIAVKESRPVTARDLEEVGQCRGEPSCGSSVPRHGTQQAAQATLHGCPSELVGVREDVSRPMHPAVGDPHVRPQGGRLGQASLEERLQPDERLGEGPLFATRSRLVAIAVSRSCSFSPEAASGG